MMGIYGYPTLGIRTGKRRVPEAIPAPVLSENLYPHPWVLTSQAFRKALGIGDGREEGGARARVGLSIFWPHCHALDLLPRRATLVVGDMIVMRFDLPVILSEAQTFKIPLALMSVHRTTSGTTQL
jgi:hypothetical protein